MAEQHQLQDQNAMLQHRLVEMFLQRRPEDTHRDEHTTTDYDKRYTNYMGM